MKTPEQMAEEWVSKNTTGSETYEHGLRNGFLAGYEAGQKITDQEIVDIMVDIREREAKEQNRMPPLQQKRHDHIWEKIKVRLVGIF